jgi:hypothetical protein
MLVSYALVLAAVALQLLALWPSAASAPAQHASALAWVAAFGLLSVALHPLARTAARGRRARAPPRESCMTFVVTESCIKCKYTDCVDV